MNLGDKCQKSDSLKREKTAKFSLLAGKNRPPSHPLRSLNSQKASGGLSLSLFLSNDSAWRRASGSGDNGCIQPSRKKVRVARTPLVVLDALGGI